MKRIDTNLDYFAKIFNVEQSPERKPVKMDDDEFLYLFPLTEIDDVVDLESRLLDDCSDFKEKFVSYFNFFFFYCYNCYIPRTLRKIFTKVCTERHDCLKYLIFFYFLYLIFALNL